MGLSIDSRKITSAQIVPWKPGEWGVAWETGDGQHGADKIGKKAEAERIVDEILKGQSTAVIRPTIVP